VGARIIVVIMRRLLANFVPAPREPIPWRRLASLVRPARRSLLSMVALTLFGSLLGLVPPLALGALVNDLAGGHHSARAGLAVALIVAALLLEAFAFALSDGFFARAVGTLYRDLRVLMFRGVHRRRRSPTAAEELAGVASRFISDAEALQDVVVAPLDTAVMGLFELLSALLALALLYLPAALLGAGMIVLTALVARFTQAPLAPAAQARQEALEAMSSSLAAELSARLERDASSAATGRFREAASRVRRREVRLGWLEAANRYGSAAAANLGPIAVVVLAALERSFSAGALIALLLLAERAFQGADSLIDLGLDVELVRGAVGRCFELVDAWEPINLVRAGGFEPPRA
jgi:ABC-type multidrug transport system fused ATPase/permease subunit